MPPDLFLHPVFDKREAPTRVPHRKVVYPSPKDRINQFDHPPNRLADVPPEQLPELLQQRRPLLQPRRDVRPPHSLTTANATEIKAQECNAVPFGKVCNSALFLVNLNLQFGHFLTQSPVHRRQSDAGREGELIFRYIYEAAQCAKPVSRLWISSLTPEAIRKGFET